MFTLGIRAHDFGKLPVDQLADKIASYGLSGIQLAIAKAIDGINSDTGAQSPGLARHLRERFARKGIHVAVLGCYVNIVHPDLKERAALMTRFKEHLRFVRDYGCSVVATETASLNADWSWHPGNNTEEAFQTAIRSIAELVQEAEKFGVFTTIEGVSTHVMNTPQRMRRMLDEISSQNLQVLFDPVNLLSIDNYKDQERIMKDSFELFGDRMIVIHAKDFKVENGVFRSVPAGLGQLDYKLLKSLIRQRKSHIDVLLEDTSEATLAKSVAFMKE